MLTGVSGGRCADWLAARGGGQRVLDAHRIPLPARGIDGAKDVNADGGLW